jgi:hypothetical protein
LFRKAILEQHLSLENLLVPAVPFIPLNGARPIIALKVQA